MGKSLILRAFAKANLSLNITGKRGNFHTLDGVMMSVDAFDIVTVTQRDDTDICVRFTNAAVGENNTALRAALTVRELLGCNGWNIVIEKGIPIGAGLGGSSADGAAVLRALDLFYGLPSRGVDMQKVALSVGSDVPFMLTGGIARVKGCGEDTFFMENKLRLFGAGLMSGSVSTAAAYERFDRLHADGVYCPSDVDGMCNLILDGKTAALSHCGNALQESAIELEPSVGRNVELLKQYTPATVMTGSGGMVIGWFDDMNKFVECAAALKGEKGFKALAPVKTGILHEWQA